MNDGLPGGGRCHPPLFSPHIPHSGRSKGPRGGPLLSAAPVLALAKVLKPRCLRRSGRCEPGAPPDVRCRPEWQGWWGRPSDRPTGVQTHPAGFSLSLPHKSLPCCEADHPQRLLLPQAWSSQVRALSCRTAAALLRSGPGAGGGEEAAGRRGY